MSLTDQAVETSGITVVNSFDNAKVVPVIHQEPNKYYPGYAGIEGANWTMTVRETPHMAANEFPIRMRIAYTDPDSTSTTLMEVVLSGRDEPPPLFRAKTTTDKTEISKFLDMKLHLSNNFGLPEVNEDNPYRNDLRAKLISVFSELQPVDPIKNNLAIQLQSAGLPALLPAIGKARV